jgi:lipoprotein-anchoring transpeptidase ErfK/SrfK
MIHGHGSGRDWTAGCVALDDRDVEELYNALPLGTPVRIVP